MQAGVSVEGLLNLIKEKDLDRLAEETKVDKHVKKLTGKSLFQLFLYSLIESERVSLRVMEQYYQSPSFREFSKKSEDSRQQTSHTSLSDRLRTVKAEYFEKIFLHLVERANQIKGIKENKPVMRYDSTIVSLSSKLLKLGLSSSKHSKNQIKYTVAFDVIPQAVKVFTDKSAVASEDLALKDVILSSSRENQPMSIAVFDRGLSARKTYRELDEKKQPFVTRLKDRARYLETTDAGPRTNQTIGDLVIERDREVRLAQSGSRFLKERYRLITAHHVTQETKVYHFLTNIRDWPAEEILELYRKRWDIEVYFRFIKQELNARHFISRDINGIKVTVYMVMILAVLLLMYRAMNGLTGYKIMKLRFKQELEVEIIKDIVVLCGGDPARLQSHHLRLRTLL